MQKVDQGLLVIKLRLQTQHLASFEVGEEFGKLERYNYQADWLVRDEIHNSHS